jgi:hypothetical protein
MKARIGKPQLPPVGDAISVQHSNASSTAMVPSALLYNNPTRQSLRLAQSPVDQRHRLLLNTRTTAEHAKLQLCCLQSVAD